MPSKKLSPSVSDKLQLTFGGYSCAGVKAENQDAFAACQPQLSQYETKGAVAAIADGASCAKYAAKAAQTAVTQFIEQYLATPDTWSTKKSVSKVLNSLNQWLCSQDGINNPTWLTTFSGLVLKSATGYVFHLGDTRISQYRQQQLTHITQDHCQKSVLTRALGADHYLNVDMHQFALANNDIYLLTCDGVHDVVSSKFIKRILSKLPDNVSQKQLEQCAQQIVEQAKQQGSEDNLTCLLVKIQQIPNLSLDDIEQCLKEKVIPPALKVGQKLDNYQIIRCIHASTRSHLYLVKCLETQTTKVLKTPSVNFADDALYLQGFIREAWLGSKLNHPNIMQVSTAGTNSRFLYHIGEYVEGQTLTSWMAANPKPSLAQVQSIIKQIVAALRAFQRLDLVHRDVKPDNIMIDKFGQIKLLDYGTVQIASLAELQQQIPDEIPQGTADYIAPEALLELKSSHLSDLYSVAVICYQLLAGELPFKPFTVHQAEKRTYQNWQYRSLKLYRPDLPLWLDLALKQATSPNPKNRYQAFSEFETALAKPNQQLINEYQQQPLIQKNPVLFWQSLSLLLFLLLLISVIF